ncbi:hypothetical protein B0H21DRAFT_238781 [Amylocystis lapponica]|nr:hypothetical protein B0H21DRAFT_238781 [Amylocystis lapponica]
METRLLPVRALYTINGSPQYILARSNHNLSVTVIPSHLLASPTSSLPNDPRLAYGRAPLRPCLDAICRSSPELVPDRNRDFSVYVLDPLESHSLSASNNPLHPQPHNHPQSSDSQPLTSVAIGLGLMSWALRTSDADITVTGTIVGDDLREDALEVIFSLRETAHVPKPAPRKALQQEKSRSPFTTAPLPPRDTKRPIPPPSLSVVVPPTSTLAETHIASTTIECGPSVPDRPSVTVPIPHETTQPSPLASSAIPPEPEAPTPNPPKQPSTFFSRLWRTPTEIPAFLLRYPILTRLILAHHPIQH